MSSADTSLDLILESSISFKGGLKGKIVMIYMNGTDERLKVLLEFFVRSSSHFAVIHRF